MDRFNISEINMICIYLADCKNETIINIMSAIPDFLERELVTIAESAIIKLDTLTDEQFHDMNFAEQFTD